MASNDIHSGDVAAPAGWRFKVGVILFASMVLLWLLVPLQAALGASPKTIAATVAGIAIANKVILLIAIAVMGKAGFQELKGRIFGYLKNLSPAQEVSSGRYKLGLGMFLLPFIHNVLETWASHISPSLVLNSLWVDLAMDVLLIASLFVLGGNFWDKIRALFVHDARAVFSGDSK